MIKTAQENFGNFKKNELFEKSIVDVSLETISYKEKSKIIESIKRK